MQPIASPQGTMNGIGLAVDDPSEARMDESHGAHRARLFNQVTVVSSTEIWPARQNNQQEWWIQVGLYSEPLYGLQCQPSGDDSGVQACLYTSTVPECVGILLSACGGDFMTKCLLHLTVASPGQFTGRCTCLSHRQPVELFLHCLHHEPPDLPGLGRAAASFLDGMCTFATRK